MSKANPSYTNSADTIAMAFARLTAAADILVDRDNAAADRDWNAAFDIITKARINSLADIGALANVMKDACAEGAEQWARVAEAAERLGASE